MTVPDFAAEPHATTTRQTMISPPPGDEPARKRGAATRDPMAQKIARVRMILGMRDSQTLSNRDLAELVCVDEAMIRRWKHRLGIPQLPQHSGVSGGITDIDVPDDEPKLVAPPKRKRGRKPKPKTGKQ